MEKPDVDQIDGLSPAISIDQKGASRNPRSTVGTVTEIYDYLRLLFARIGHPHCPVCGREIERQTVQQMVDQVLRAARGKPVARAGPVVKDRKTEGDRVFEAARKQGFVRVRVDGELLDLEEARALDKYKRHTIEVVVDRFVVRHAETPGEALARTPRGSADSIETALRLGEGVVVDRAGRAGRRDAAFEEQRYSERYACPTTAPRSTSWSRAASPSTRRTARARPAPGIGTQLEIDPDLVIPEPRTSLPRGRWCRGRGWRSTHSWRMKILEAIFAIYGWDVRAPIRDLPPEAVEHILHSAKEEQVVIAYRHERGENTYTATFEGIITNLERRYRETDSEYIKTELETVHGRAGRARPASASGCGPRRSASRSAAGASGTSPR